MRFETSQQMRLGQQMKLAPRMIQSMEILQMPMLALQERIDQELESNIALEQVEPGSDAPVEDRTGPTETDDTAELNVGEDASSADDWERLSDLESSYGEAFENEYSSERYSASRMAGERDRKMDALANVAARDESLTEQLLGQWRLAEVGERHARIGEHLIGAINEDGILGSPLEAILEQQPELDGIALDLEQLVETLDELQHWLEPAGIAARDVREALLLQVDDQESRDIDNPAWEDVRILVRDHFEDLLENRLPRIAQSTGLPMERIAEAKTLMRQLTPAPGRELVSQVAAPIIPDVVVEYDEEQDAYVATLRDGFLPVLRISANARDLSRDRAQEQSTREFASENVRRATWLLEAINQRSNTLLRVVNVVLTRQRDFFDQGPQHLKPLPMIEVADQLGVHVATVSRAVADKWMQTPRGLLPLRMFFSGGRETDTGRDMSWEAVRATLQEIVDAEDKSKPLSDEALASALRDRGIEIARRTVVKYRQKLGIPSARRRKEFA